METKIIHCWSSFDRDMHKEFLTSKNTVFWILAAEEWDMTNSDISWSPSYPALLARSLAANNVQIKCLIGRANLNTIDPVLYQGIHTHDLLYSIRDSVEVHYFPSWFVLNHSSLYVSGNPERFPYTFDNFTQTFSCRNRMPHPHRCILMDTLAEYNLIESNNITWNILSPKCFDHVYPWQHWQEKLIPDTNGDIAVENHNSLYTVDPDGYTNSLIDLISESTVATVFITEKTLLPIMAKKPFIVYGGVGTHKLLSEWGFEMFTEIFDYSFDQMPCPRQRARAITEQLSKIEKSNPDYNALYQKLLPKCERNFLRLMEIIRTGDTVPDIVKNNPEIFKHYHRTMSGCVLTYTNHDYFAPYFKN